MLARWSSWAGIAVIVAIGLVAIRYGPELLAYRKLARGIEAASAETAAAPPAASVCVICHGFGGNGLTQIYPRLAGQPAEYVRAQLGAFADGRRANPTMSPMAMALSREEWQAVAEYFAAQPTEHNTAFVPDPARAAKGEVLAPVCAACHGPASPGRNVSGYLAGQGHDYLRKQLSDYKSGQRGDATGAMTAVARNLSDEDIENLAQYLAAQ